MSIAEKSVALKELFSHPYFGDQAEYADTAVPFQAIMCTNSRWEPFNHGKKTVLSYIVGEIEVTHNAHRLVYHIDNTLKAVGHTAVVFRPNSNSSGVCVIFSRELKEKRREFNSVSVLLWAGMFECTETDVLFVNDIDDLLNHTGNLLADK